MKKREISVLKFGGTSVGSAENISSSAQIVANEARKRDTVVVVSAVGGVTDELIALVDLAKKQKQRLIAGRLNRLEEKHREILQAFVPTDTFASVWGTSFAPGFKKLRYILTGISYVGELTKKTYAYICSFGELLSSQIVSHALNSQQVPSCQIHAKRVIRTNSDYLEAEVDFRRTRECSRRVLMPLLQERCVPVVMGFIGKDTRGNTTMLGRGGSDYTASLLGLSLDADEIQIWTDVDGVMSADPRVISNVRLWSRISLDVMAEMASSGAKVLHPKTVTAAVQKDIPVYIKNTFNPDAPGTLVTKESRPGLKGVQCVKGQMLIHLQTPEMLHAFGFIQQCSRTFVDHNVAIDVCATSEITFTCSISEADYSTKLKKSLAKIAHVNLHRDMAKICVIGTDISRDAALISRIFQILKPYPVYTVSVGASFHNITLFVAASLAEDVMMALHSQLFEL